MGNLATGVGTSNIALIKYWGKRNEQLILPTNSSISITLDEQLSAKTSVLFTNEVKEDVFFLNGKRQDMEDKELGEKFQVINKLRAISGIDEKVIVASENNFPTAAGLASSAAGMATLVFVASNALGMNLSKKELSILVRLGSGSACRSVLGGFVRWRKGESDEGGDSYAEQIFDEKHWADIVDLVTIVSEGKKRVSSRSGMKQTMQTSFLYKSRPEFAERMSEELFKAIKDRDFQKLAEITMRDSNNMHATMLDTYPPISYHNDVSIQIMQRIHLINDSAGESTAAYTFDAGPNAHIITLKKNVDMVKEELSKIDGVNRFIESGVGSGPRLLGKNEALISQSMLEGL